MKIIKHCDQWLKAYSDGRAVLVMVNVYEDEHGQPLGVEHTERPVSRDDFTWPES